MCNLTIKYQVPETSYRKWILQFIGLIMMVGCLVNSDQNNKKTIRMDCEIGIPFITIDSVQFMPGKRLYFVSDVYDLVDWYFYMEAVLTPEVSDCLNLANLNPKDTIGFVFQYEERDLKINIEVDRFLKQRDLRQSLPCYRRFVDKNFGSKEFRSQLSLLTHLYGKEIDPDPKDGLMYYENFLEFLVGVEYKDFAKVSTNEDSILLDKIIHQLDSHKNIDEIYHSLTDFINCLNSSRI